MGTYIISVAFEPGTYRQIRISSSASLRELSDTITLAYDLDEAHRPVFEAAASKKTWPKKFAGSNTKTTLNMRQVALHDSPFAGKGQVIYSLDRPRLRFTCRRLSALDEETEAPMVIARSGGLMMPLRHLAQVLRRLDKHPGRLAEVEADLETSNLGAALRRTLKRYLRSAANLYGVVPLSLVREIFSRHHGEISPLALARIAFDTSWIDGNQFAVVDQQGELADPDHLDLARYLVYDDLLEAGAFEAVLKQQAGKPFYTPPPAELLAYADDAYAPPSTQLQALRDFLVGIGLPARDAEVWMGEITCAIRCGAQGTELLEDMFKRYKLRLRSMEEGDRMLRLYADLANNTRMHANCGHTPEELFRPRGGKTADKLIPFPSLAGAQPMEEDPGLTKPRRNGPCPCGSGNKYKQCCGRTEP